MGCGASITFISEAQRNDLFTAGAKECMRRSLIFAYRHKDEINVLAPSKELEKIRKYAESLHKASEVARDKCTDTVGAATDSADAFAAKAADLAGDKGGFLGKLAGSVVEAGVNVAGAATDLAASGAGLAAEKAIKLVAVAMDAAIGALDQPFKDVGKDIFASKENEIIAAYCTIIDKKVRIANAVQCVRGDAPYGEAQYKLCKSGCVDTMHTVCKTEITEDLKTVVQGEINKHLVTKVWDGMIEKYNEANQALKKYSVLKEFLGEDIKLDINEYIVSEVVQQFHQLMVAREIEIRASPAGKSDQMPVVFPKIFSGHPYDQFTLEDFANMNRKDTC
jgi:hypothetical protein